MDGKKGSSEACRSDECYLWIKETRCGVEAEGKGAPRPVGLTALTDILFAKKRCSILSLLLRLMGVALHYLHIKRILTCYGAC